MDCSQIYKNTAKGVGNVLGGGGIYNDGSSGSATLTLTNSKVFGNTAIYHGGGILNYGLYGTATLTLKNSRISGNAADYGGGIYNSVGLSGIATVNLVSGSIDHNTATGGSGGGIFNLVGLITGDTNIVHDNNPPP